MLVADELDARLGDVDVPLSDGRPDLLFNQLTGASNSVRSLYDPVRAAAAAARARLVTAAARRWSLLLPTRCAPPTPPSSPPTAVGPVTANSPPRQPPWPSRPCPPPRSRLDQQRLVGRLTGRIDARSIVTGRAKYAA